MLVVLRVGFFSPTINRVGGGEWVTLNMIHALKAKRYEVVIYSAERINSANIHSFFGNSIDFDREVSFWPNLFDPFSLENIYPNMLKSFFFSFKCDILIDTFSNDLHPWTDAIYFQGIPRILRLPRGKRKLAFLPYATLSKGTLRSSRSQNKTLMACSKSSAKTIEYLTKLPVNVLYPPVSGYFRDKIISDQPRNNRVVSVVRMAEDKRPETILQIAKMVSTRSVFIVIGSCKTPNEINVLRRFEKTIQELGLTEKVKLALNVSRKKQKEILRTSKVYVHPFVPYESFGVSVIEAMSAGCTPVVPDVGGLKEIVSRKQRYTTVEEAASLIEESISNWSLRSAKEYVDSTNKFSQARFETEFLRIMKFFPQV